VLSRPPPTLAPDRGEQTLRPVKSAPVPSINADIEIAAMGEEDEDVDLLELFLEDSRSRLSLLSRATASGDTAMVVGAAHAMKGAAASIGLEAIRDVCETLERDAEQGRVPDPSQLNQLIRLLEQL
jgi:HPt (histidine-containing phosphotransfer) domain-containing protein